MGRTYETKERRFTILNKLIDNVKNEEIRKAIILNHGLHGVGFQKTVAVFVNKKIKTKAFRINQELLATLRSLQNGNKKTEKISLNKPDSTNDRIIAW